jgi:hypothetical protein
VRLAPHAPLVAARWRIYAPNLIQPLGAPRFNPNPLFESDGRYTVLFLPLPTEFLTCALANALTTAPCRRGMGGEVLPLLANWPTTGRRSQRGVEFRHASLSLFAVATDHGSTGRRWPHGELLHPRWSPTGPTVLDADTHRPWSATTLLLSRSLAMQEGDGRMGLLG